MCLESRDEISRAWQRSNYGKKREILLALAGHGRSEVTWRGLVLEEMPRGVARICDKPK